MSFFKSTYDCTHPWVTQLSGPDLQNLNLPEVPPPPVTDEATAPASDPVLYRSDLTDMGTGSSDGTFYFIDGDTSLILD